MGVHPPQNGTIGYDPWPFHCVPLSLLITSHHGHRTKRQSQAPNRLSLGLATPGPRFFVWPRTTLAPVWVWGSPKPGLGFKEANTPPPPTPPGHPTGDEPIYLEVFGSKGRCGSSGRRHTRSCNQRGSVELGPIPDGVDGKKTKQTPKNEVSGVRFREQPARLFGYLQIQPESKPPTLNSE